MNRNSNSNKKIENKISTVEERRWDLLDGVEKGLGDLLEKDEDNEMMLKYLLII